MKLNRAIDGPVENIALQSKLSYNMILEIILRFEILKLPQNLKQKHLTENNYDWSVDSEICSITTFHVVGYPQDWKDSEICVILFFPGYMEQIFVI